MDQPLTSADRLIRRRVLMPTALLWIGAALMMAAPAFAQVQPKPKLQANPDFPIRPKVLQQIELPRDFRFEQLAPPGATVLFSMPTAEQLQGVRIDPSLRSCVGQLDDPSFATREQATNRLMDDSTDRLQLYAMLSRADLAAEQRYRLLNVLRERLTKTPRGALGISTNPFPMVQQGPGGQPGIRVEDLIPGLPAEHVLRIGDRITHIDSRPVMQMSDLQFIVQCKRPGEKVQLNIQRPQVDADGKFIMDANNQPVLDPMQVEIELGSAERLKEFNSAIGRGQSMQPSPVEAMRLAEAGEAQRKFSPVPQPIAVRGGPMALVAATAQAAGANGSIENCDDPEIDQEPLIQNLIMQRKLIADGRLNDSRPLRDAWKNQLRILIEQVTQPDLSDKDREYLKRVIDRYADLMRD